MMREWSTSVPEQHSKIFLLPDSCSPQASELTWLFITVFSTLYANAREKLKPLPGTLPPLSLSLPLFVTS